MDEVHDSISLVAIQQLTSKELGLKACSNITLLHTARVARFLTPPPGDALKHKNCLFAIKSLGGQIMAGFQAGCLPLAVEVGRYFSIPYDERVCKHCDCREAEDQHHCFIICHTLSSIRQKLFNHSLTLSISFAKISSYDKSKFLLRISYQ